MSERHVEIVIEVPLKTGEPDSTSAPMSPEQMLSPDAQVPPIEEPEVFKFSWNATDEETPEFKYGKKTCCIYIFSLYQRAPLLLRYALYAFSGSALIFIPGLVSYFFFVEDKTAYFVNMQPLGQSLLFTIAGIPFFVWSVYFTILWCSSFGLLWAFKSLPEIIARLVDVFLGAVTGNSVSTINTGIRISHYLDYLRHIRVYLAFVTWTAVSLTSWTLIFSARPNLTDPLSWFNVITRIWTTLLLASIIYTIEKLLLQIFAIQFHRRVYLERIDKNKDCYSVLSKLNKCIKQKKSLNNQESPESISIPEDSKTLLDRQAALANKIGSKAADVSKQIFNNITNVMGAAVGLDIGSSSNTIILRNAHDAQMLAKKLFRNLAQGPCDNVYLENFVPYFKTHEDAVNAFALFDKDANGDISKQEMKFEVLEIFNERIHLEKSMRSSGQAIGKLDIILKSIASVIVLFISLSIWKVDTSSFLTSFITIWAGLIFAVGGTIKNMMESMIFLFLTHPYDVGDRVDIDDVGYTVIAFGITTTVFKRGDGKEIYAPNTLLVQKFIHNVRRSGNQSEDIKIQVAFSTPMSKLQLLRDKLLLFLTQNSRDFIPKLEITLNSIVDRSTILVQMSLEHKGNWADGSKKSARRNKFMHALKDGITEFGIVLCGGVDVTLMNSEWPIRLDPSSSKSMRSDIDATGDLGNARSHVPGTTVDETREAGRGTNLIQRSAFSA